MLTSNDPGTCVHACMPAGSSIRAESLLLKTCFIWHNKLITGFCVYMAVDPEFDLANLECTIGYMYTGKCMLLLLLLLLSPPILP